MSRSRSVCEHVEKHLWPMRVVAPLVFSSVIALSAAAFSVWTQVHSVRSISGSVRNHLASLIETQDRPEISRLVKSMKRQTGYELSVVHDGIVIGSTRSSSDLEKPVVRTSEKPIFLNKHTLAVEISEPVKRDNGPQMDAQLVTSIPIQRPLVISLLIGVVAFLLGLVFSFFNQRLIRSGVQAALRPLQNLSTAIRQLAMATQDCSMAPSGVQELDVIRESVLATQADLVEARERLAKAHAKEMAADAYRRLIHDLRTPVSTLQKLASAAERYPEDALVQAETKRRIPKLTEQILGQLSAASQTLEFEEPRPILADLRESVLDAKEQIDAIAPLNVQKSIRIESSLPREVVHYLHDKVLVTRAVINLLKNAMETQCSRIKVSLASVINEYTSIVVEDNGPGLDPKEIPAFLKGRGKSTKADRFGIGLATVNHIATLHGAKLIYGRSDLGGARFEIRFVESVERRTYG